MPEVTRSSSLYDARRHSLGSMTNTGNKYAPAVVLTTFASIFPSFSTKESSHAKSEESKEKCCLKIEERINHDQLREVQAYLRSSQVKTNVGAIMVMKSRLLDKDRLPTDARANEPYNAELPMRRNSCTSFSNNNDLGRRRRSFIHVSRQESWKSLRERKCEENVKDLSHSRNISCHAFCHRAILHRQSSSPSYIESKAALTNTRPSRTQKATALHGQRGSQKIVSTSLVAGCRPSKLVVSYQQCSKRTISTNLDDTTPCVEQVLLRRQQNSLARFKSHSAKISSRGNISRQKCLRRVNSSALVGNDQQAKLEALSGIINDTFAKSASNDSEHSRGTFSRDDGKRMTLNTPVARGKEEKRRPKDETTNFLFSFSAEPAASHRSLVARSG